jgi:hypothetical protein
MQPTDSPQKKVAPADGCGGDGPGPAASALRFMIEDSQGRPLASRLHLTDASGKPQSGPEPYWRDHSVGFGRFEYSLPAGRYRYEIERGPEWETVRGEVDLPPGEERVVTVRPAPIADMNREGWYSGDLHIHRPPGEMPLHLAAEGLNLAPVITWWNEHNYWQDRPIPDDLVLSPERDRLYELMAGEDERDGGALLYFGLDQPLPIAESTWEYPSSLHWVAEARRRKAAAWIDIEKPFWWDAALWLASGEVDSIGVANNHMHRSGIYEGEAWGRARDLARYPGQHGNGYWTQAIYYHALNCGLRLPPSAGSASGVIANPVGYNRVYVYLPDQTGNPLAAEDWWRALKAGRAFVTNGPLLRCRAADQFPGHVFQSRSGEPLTIPLAISLTTKDPVRQVEIIRDGEVAGVLPTLGHTTEELTGSVTFTHSGWFLIRAIADVPHTFRFASTAPFYVEVGGQQTIRRDSVRFFQDWLEERIDPVIRSLDDAEQRRSVLRYHEEARRFWQELSTSATTIRG